MRERAAAVIGRTCLTVTARVELGPDPANGAIVSQCGKLGGWSLYLKDGVPTCAHNWAGQEAWIIRASEPVCGGSHEFKLKFECDGCFPRPGMNFTLLSDGKAIASRHFKNAAPPVAGNSEGGEDFEFPLEEDFHCTRMLTGSIRGAVTVDFSAGDHFVDGRRPYDGITVH